MAPNVWWMTLKRSFVLLGYSLFSTLVVIRSVEALYSAAIAAGLYFFYEMSRIVKVNGQNVILKKAKKKKKQFVTLI